jgi:hypothetical protein
MAKRPQIPDDSTLPLFDDGESVVDPTPRRKDLIVAGRKNAPLSKEQKAFNRLTIRIEETHQLIEQTTARLDTLLADFTRSIPDLRARLARARLDLAHVIAASARSIKYGPRQTEKLRDTILMICEDAFDMTEPEASDIALYDEWSEITYKEQAQADEAAFREEMSAAILETFGVDIPFDFEQTPEGFAQFQHKMREELSRAQEEAGTRRHARPKSAKQREREMQRLQTEALKTKSLRSIYHSLAKALHPDTTPDPLEAEIKEELMKRVTDAYQRKDLPALLRLEMEWVRSEHEHLESLPEETLKGYIAALKEQLAELEEEYRSLFQHPRYGEVGMLGFFHKHNAGKVIVGMEAGYRAQVAITASMIDECSRPKSKKKIMETVDILLRADSESFDDFPFRPGMPFPFSF